MAITIEKSPEYLTAVYNEVVAVVISSNATQSNFNFVADVYKTFDSVLVPDELLAVVKFPVNPEGYGVLDIHKHLQTQISDDFDPTSKGVKHAPKTYTKYRVDFKEEFRPEWAFLDNGGSPQLRLFGLEDPTDYLNVGDEIIVAQAPGFTNPAYNGTTTISSFYYDAAYEGWVIVTTKAFTVSGFNAGGTVTLSNYDSVRTATLASISSQVSFNGVLTFDEFINWDYTIYDAGNNSAKFVTQMPEEYVVRRHSKLFLNMFSKVDGYLNFVKIRVGNNTYYIRNFLVGGTRDFFNVALGPDQINSSNVLLFQGASGYIPATQPVIPSSATEYSVGVTPDPELLDSITLTKIKIEDACSKYEDVQLLVMDKLGSFIPFHFDLVNRHTLNVKKTSYQTDYGKYASASNSWDYKSWDRGARALDTEVTESYTITSNWVDQELGDLMMTILDSPEVYWVQEDGTVTGISLTVNSVERKQTINDQLINYTFSFNLANKNKKQLG